jgi:hypothetical protein
MMHESEERFLVAFLDEHHIVESWVCPWRLTRIGVELEEHGNLKNSFCGNIESLVSPCGRYWKSRVVWCGDQSPNKVYDLCTHDYELAEWRSQVGTYGTLCNFVCNHTKKEIVDKSYLHTKYIEQGYSEQPHPLPLLTLDAGLLNILADSKKSWLPWPFSKKPKMIEYVGSWARDSISVEREYPSGYTDITQQLLKEIHRFQPKTNES